MIICMYHRLFTLTFWLKSIKLYRIEFELCENKNESNVNAHIKWNKTKTKKKKKKKKKNKISLHDNS